MRALIFTGNRSLSLTQAPAPNPGPGEVLIQIARASICGTDIHKFRAPAGPGHHLGDGAPCVVGHEPAGWIAAVGPGVTARTVGQRVLVAGVIGCGACSECQAGYNVSCLNGPYGLHWNHHGCDADYLVFPATNAIALPDAVSFEAAAVMTCAGGTAMTSLREAGAEAGMSVAVVGLGPVGLCTVILAKALGCRVVGIEPNADRRAMALEVGCDLALDPQAGDAVAAAKAAGDRHGFHIVVECVGQGETQRMALALAGPRGAVALAGLGKDRIELDCTAALIGRSARLIGIAATPIKYFHELVALAAKRALPFEKLITHRFPLDQAREAFAVMESGQCGKVILTVSEAFKS